MATRRQVEEIEMMTHSNTSVREVVLLNTAG